MRVFIFFLLGMLFAVPPPILAQSVEGEKAKSSASGKGIMMVGEDPYNFDESVPIDGSIFIKVTNKGDRGSPLQNKDQISVEAEFSSEDGDYHLIMYSPLLSDPKGKDPTWFGVGYEKPLHGSTNTRTNKLPEMEPKIVVYGWADVYLDGKLLQSRVPAQVKVMKDSNPSGIMLEVGTDSKSIPNTPTGYLHIYWPEVDELLLPKDDKRTREWLGMGFLILLNVWFGFLAIREKRFVP